MVPKHFVMTSSNQIEQLVDLQEKIFQQMLTNENQVSEVKTRGGST
jgi:hypothetical protein